MLNSIAYNLYTIQDLLTKSNQNVHVQPLAGYTSFEISVPQEPIEPIIAHHPFNAGEFVFINDLEDKHKWYVAKLLVVDRGPEEYVIHFYHSYNEKSHPAKRVCKPVYVDSKDGKEVFTSRPLPRYEARTITVDNSHILLPYSFRLSSQGKVHVWHLKELANCGKVEFTYK